MTTLSYPKIEINAAGQLAIFKDGVSLDPLGWEWEASTDGGETWREQQLREGMFSVADTSPEALYRARETISDKQLFDPLYHEILFSLTEEVSSWGIVTWTLTQPATEYRSDPIVTKTFSDPQDVVAWSSMVHRTQGDQYEEREVRDDGSVETRTYQIDEGLEYIPQSSTTEDAANLTNWRSITTWFDETRSQDIKLIIFDSGSERSEFRGADGLNEVLWTDGADTQPWETLTYLYHNGSLTEQIRLNDTGEETQYFYGSDESGVSYIQSIVRSDELENGGTFAWRTIETQFSADREKLSREINYDDGRLLEDRFENDMLSSRVITDTADAAMWEMQIYRYRDGVQTERVLLNDNGLQVERLFETDVSGKSFVRSKLCSDLSPNGDTFAWQTIETRFDEGGDKLNSLVLYDDGRVREDEFEHGALRSRLFTDVEDQFAWYQINEAWEDGIRITRDVIDDTFMLA